MYRISDNNFQPTITENGAYMLRFRYLKKNSDGSFEKPVVMFRRVAWNLAQAEVLFNPSLTEPQIMEYANRFFSIMTDFKFLPNAPTLLGAGRSLQQLLACFVLPIEDSIEAIFNTVRLAALVHSKGGGTGFSFSQIRSRGTAIFTGGVSTGPVSFMRVFDNETQVIKEGGTGWGANMGVLRCNHPDIREFVCAKSNKDRLHNFNLSVGITDEFMRLYQIGGNLPLLDPHTKTIVSYIPAGELLDLICEEAWKTGDPGLLFIDRINQDNPTPALGSIEATNPCGEAPLLPFEACCLGGINVAKFFDNETDQFRWTELQEVASLALRMMDNVIEVSKFPTPEIRVATHRTRKVGIGIMGFADLLLQMRVAYNSIEAETIAKKLMRTVQQATYRTSEQLAQERGSFPAFKGSIWEKRGYRQFRNATTTSNAPNSTISVIAGCSAGIEPLFSIVYDKQLENGDHLKEINPYFLEQLKANSLYSEDLLNKVCSAGSIQHFKQIPEELKCIFVTSHDINPIWHIRIQSAFQKHTDLGISKTINLPNYATPKDIKEAFLVAYELGCKGVTCYRDRCLDTQFLSIAPVDIATETCLNC